MEVEMVLSICLVIAVSNFTYVRSIGSLTQRYRRHMVLSLCLAHPIHTFHQAIQLLKGFCVSCRPLVHRPVGTSSNKLDYTISRTPAMNERPFITPVGSVCPFIHDLLRNDRNRGREISIFYTITVHTEYGASSPVVTKPQSVLEEVNHQLHPQ